MKPGAVYAARLAAAWGIALGVMVWFVAKEEFFRGGHLISLLAQLDLFHSLFYAWIAVGAALLPVGGKGLKNVPFALAYAVSIVAVPLAATEIARPALVGVLPWQILVGPLLLAVNAVALAAPAEDGEESAPRPLHYAARAWVAADILTPLAVWRVYRPTGGLVAAALKPAAVALIALLANAPLFFVPLDTDPRADIDPAFRNLPPARGYQLAVDPADGSVLLSANNNDVLKLEGETGAVLHAANFGEAASNNQGFAIDVRRREIAYGEPCAGVVQVLDLGDLSLKRREVVGVAEADRPYWCGNVGAWAMRAACFPEDGALVAFTFQPGFVLFSPGEPAKPFSSGDAALDEKLAAFTADAVCDSPRRRAYITNIGRWLAALDVRQRRVVAMRRLRAFPERLAVDTERDLVYVTLPTASEVAVFAGEDLRPVTTIASLPGVRTIAVSPELDAVLLGGFAPYLEWRSRRDYALIDRIAAPPWSRWIDVDAERKRAFVSANFGGLWRLDLTRLGGEDWRARWRRIDPFFPIAGAVTRWLREPLRRLNPNAQIFG